MPRQDLLQQQQVKRKEVLDALNNLLANIKAELAIADQEVKAYEEAQKTIKELKAADAQQAKLAEEIKQKNEQLEKDQAAYNKEDQAYRVKKAEYDLLFAQQTTRLQTLNKNVDLITELEKKITESTDAIGKLTLDDTFENKRKPYDTQIQSYKSQKQEAEKTKLELEAKNAQQINLLQELGTLYAKNHDLEEKLNKDRVALQQQNATLKNLHDQETQRKKQLEEAEVIAETNKGAAARQKAIKEKQEANEKLYKDFLEPGEEKEGYKDGDKENIYNQYLELNATDNPDENEKKAKKIGKDAIDKAINTKGIDTTTINAIRNYDETNSKIIKELQDENSVNRQKTWNDLQVSFSRNHGKGVAVNSVNGKIEFDKDKVDQYLAEVEHDSHEEDGYRKNGIKIGAGANGGTQAFGHDTMSTLAVARTELLKHPNSSFIIKDGNSGQRNIAAKETFKRGAIARIIYPDAEGQLWNKIFNVKRDLKTDTRLFANEESSYTALIKQIANAKKADNSSKYSPNEKAQMTYMVFSALDPDQIEQVFEDLKEQETKYPKDIEKIKKHYEVKREALQKKLVGTNPTPAQVTENESINQQILDLNRQEQDKLNEIREKINTLPNAKNAALRGLREALVNKTAEERAIIFEKLDAADQRDVLDYLFQQSNYFKNSITVTPKQSWIKSSPKKNNYDIMFKEFVQQMHGSSSYDACYAAATGQGNTSETPLQKALSMCHKEVEDATAKVQAKSAGSR